MVQVSADFPPAAWAPISFGANLKVAAIRVRVDATRLGQATFTTLVSAESVARPVLQYESADSLFFSSTCLFK